MQLLRLLLVALVAVTQGLVVTGPLALRSAVAATSRVEDSCVMKKCSGGSSPNRDKFKQRSRGSMRKLLWEADSAEKMKEGVFNSAVEGMLLRMSWRTRNSMKLKIKKKAEELDVEVPEGFAAFGTLPRNTKPYALKGVM